MGKPTGFLEHGRELPQKVDPAEFAFKHNKEFVLKRRIWRENQHSSLSLYGLWCAVSVITAARLVTSFLSLMTRFTVTAGKKLGTF